MAKAMDTLMWELQHRTGATESTRRSGEWPSRSRSKHGITVRPMRKKDMQAEIDRFLEVYNAAWERNWGFSPLTEQEVRHYAKTLKPLLDEHWAFIAEKDGETVGAALTLPDYNQVLKHMNGRLLPFGWAKFLWNRSKIDRVRVFALGVKREYQHTGVAARFYELHFDSAERTPQTCGEMGWILETNKSMNRAMEGMGGTVVRRYRLYERLFEDALPDEASRVSRPCRSARGAVDRRRCHDAPVAMTSRRSLSPSPRRTSSSPRRRSTPCPCSPPRCARWSAWSAGSCRPCRRPRSPRRASSPAPRRSWRSVATSPAGTPAHAAAPQAAPPAGDAVGARHALVPARRAPARSRRVSAAAGTRRRARRRPRTAEPAPGTRELRVEVTTGVAVPPLARERARRRS